jgi:UDP-N-acetylglucosamine:LPS N-acetylglucosamine transferase
VLDFLLLAEAEPDKRWEQLAIVHVGGERTELLERELASVAGPGRFARIQYIRTGYLADATGALGAADFYFGRCGSATVGELLAAGLPALLMPDPQHADRQQYGNARTLVDRRQGEVIEQGSAAQGAQLADWLRRSWSKPRLAAPAPSPAEVAARELLS